MVGVTVRNFPSPETSTATSDGGSTVTSTDVVSSWASCCCPWARTDRSNVTGALAGTLAGGLASVSPKGLTQASDAPSGAAGIDVVQRESPAFSGRRHQSYGTLNISPLSPPM